MGGIIRIKYLALLVLTIMLFTIPSQPVNASTYQPYIDYITALSPEAWWRLGADGDDSSGNGHNQDNIVGAPTFVTSIIPHGSHDNCVLIDDAEGYNYPDSTAINTYSNPNGDYWAISLWFDATSVATNNGNIIYEQGGSANSIAVYTYESGGSYYIYCSAVESANYDFVSSQINTNTLYHLGCIWNISGGAIMMYINGTLVDTDSSLAVGTDLKRHTGDTAIAEPDGNPDNHLGSGMTNSFQGKIADIVLWGVDKDNAVSGQNFSDIYDLGTRQLTYPSFSNYWDDNASLSNSGTGHFNVTVANTNGTVLLEINGQNITAKNLTANMYNATYYFSSSGTYTYRWHSWGNGTYGEHNVSSDQSYTVNSTDTVYPSFSNYDDDNATLTDTGTGNFNVTVTNTNGTVWLEINGQNITASNSAGNTYNATYTFTEGGTYTYRWHSWGSGFDHHHNVSIDRDYVVFITGNNPPTQSQPTLTSTFGTDLTSENLTCNPQDTTDLDGDSVKNIFAWYKDTYTLQLLNAPFEGGSNSTYTKDYSGNGYDASVSGATWSSTGGYDGKGAYDFDGTDDYVSFGDINEMDQASAFTVSMWFYRRTDGSSATNHNINNVLLAQSSSSSNDNFELGTDGTNVEMYFDASANYAPTYNANIQNNQWYHIAVTFDIGRTNEVELYIDGSYKTGWSDTTTDLDSSGTSPLTLGLARPDGDLWGDFDGLIDDFQLFDYSLSPEQIAAIHNNRTDLIVSNETTKGEDWECEVTPNDGTDDGTTKKSDVLTILNTAPILSSTLVDDNDVLPANELDLIPYSRLNITCSSVVSDDDNENDISSGSAVLFLTSVGESAADNNLNHYTNNSCDIDVSYGDSSTALATCLFEVEEAFSVFFFFKQKTAYEMLM